MTDSDRYLIKGYLSLLETATPNARHIHRVKNKITALRFHLKLGMPLAKSYEEEIKALVHDMYPVTEQDAVG